MHWVPQQPNFFKQIQDLSCSSKKKKRKNNKNRKLYSHDRQLLFFFFMPLSRLLKQLLNFLFKSTLFIQDLVHIKEKKKREEKKIFLLFVYFFFACLHTLSFLLEFSLGPRRVVYLMRIELATMTMDGGMIITKRNQRSQYYWKQRDTESCGKTWSSQVLCH